MNNLLKLNIGAGKSYIPDFTNIDISKKADIVLDISKDKLPFADDSVDLIFSSHTLEHLENYLFALSEIHRVLKHGGILLLGLPYVTLTKYNLVNPYHKQNFNEYSFDFFDIKKLKDSAAEENPILFKKVFYRLHYLGLWKFIPPPFRWWCKNHLFNVVREIDFGLVAIKNYNIPIDSIIINKKILMQKFKKCNHSRVAYDKTTDSNSTKIKKFIKYLLR